MFTRSNLAKGDAPEPKKRLNPLSAGGWAVTSYIISYAVGALLFIPLTRLLDRGDFGLYTLATIVSSGLVLMVELSLIRALVRTPGDRDEIANGTVRLGLWGGLAGAGICALAGFPMSLIYNNERLILVLALLAPGVLLAGLGAVPHAILARELDFRRKLLPETISVGLAGGLALGAALAGLGVFSLIVYNVSRVGFNAGIAWLIVSWRPSRRPVSWATMRKLLSFGLPASGGELALYARFNVDYAIGGTRLSTDALGVYNIAWTTADRPALLINAFFDNSGYATFARLQEHRDRLRRTYLTATRLLAVVALPAFVGVLFIRQEIVDVVFGPKWQDMVEPLLPLFLLQAFWVIFRPSALMVLALGHSRLYAVCNVVGLIGTSLLLLVGTSYGLVGMAWAMLLAVGLTSLLWGGLCLYFLQPSLAEVWQAASLPLLLTAVTTPAIALGQWVGASLQMGSLLRLLAVGVLGLIAFGVVVLVSWPSLRQDFALLRQTLPEEKPAELPLVPVS